MARLCLLLIVACLALRPTPSSAAAHVHGDTQLSWDRAGVEYAPIGVRSVTGFELLQGMETRVPGRSVRSPEQSPGVPADGFLLSRVRRILAAETEQPGGVTTPHAERLPYHATAPPSAR